MGMTPNDHFELGCRLAAGQGVPRDLQGARREFAAAADRDARAGLVYAGFLAGGIGGARNWSAAVNLLHRWAGQDRLAAKQVELISAMELTAEGQPLMVPASRPLHAIKSIAMVERLFTPVECAFMMEMAGPRLRPAPVLAAHDQSGIRTMIRDADAAMFTPAEEPPFLHAVNARIAAATCTDIRLGEPLQLMRYREQQQYRPHVDGVGGGSNRRVLTAIIYLNDDYEGGATAFTELGLTIRGRAGDMLLFRNLDARGELDREMRHAGLAVTRGVKFIASRWILQRPPCDDQGNLIGRSLWA